MSDSGSSSDEDMFMSPDEHLSLSPTSHQYETPNNVFNAELADDGKDEDPAKVKERDYLIPVGYLYDTPPTPISDYNVGDDENEPSNVHHYDDDDNRLFMDIAPGVPSFANANGQFNKRLMRSIPIIEDMDTDHHIDIDIIAHPYPDEEKNSKHGDDDDDVALANIDYLIQELDNGTSENSQREQNLGSDDGGSFRPNNFAGCEICQYRGFIAFHLRHSEGCLRQLRAMPHFQVKCSDEAFIVKFSLLAGECPSPVCPSGRHTVLPEECFDWWKADGWDILGWRGGKEDADPNVIDSKIKRFLLNHKARSCQQNSMESQNTAPSQTPTAADHESQNYDANDLCGSCDQRVDLIPHFHQNEECLRVYMRHHLPEDLWRGRRDAINMRLAIFQVAIIMNICARVECTERNSSRYIGRHINRNEDCLEFYRNEGVFLALLNWKEDASSQFVGKKLSQMKRSLNEKKVKEGSCGYLSFQNELSELLVEVCSGCGAMGPDAEGVVSKMTICGRDNFGKELWRCSTCLVDNIHLEEIRQRTSERLRSQTERLKKPENQDEEEVRLIWTSPQKTVLAPSHLVSDYDGPPFVAPNLSTVILVPQQPPALENLVGLCDRALGQRTDLNKYVQEVLRRPIFTDFGDTFSCIYRSLLSDIRYRMNKILLGISSVARGEVVSLNPNVTTAVKRNPNLRMTMSGAMQEECYWSFPHEEHRSMESKARSQINGRVKIYICGTIIDDLKDDQLKRILLTGCKAFVDPNTTAFEEIEAHPAKETFITKMAPIILKYIHAKVKLFVKHIIAPHYASYDLKLKFDTDKLKVQIEGYVWARQFDQINQNIAENPEIRVLPNIVNEVLLQEASLPTATLCWRKLSETYEIEELRAKNIVQVATQYQVDGDIFPLSLINIWTPAEWSASEGEQLLRARALELSHQRAADENVEEAIIDIAAILMREGLSEELISEDINIDILRSLKLKLMEICPQQPVESINAHMWYHILLLKTGGRNQWTVKRNCGETQVVPYLPLLLEAFHEKMNVRVALVEEYLVHDIGQHASQSERLMAGFDWTEVSILEFLHGVSIQNYEEQVSETTVSIMSNQEEEQSFRESTEKDEEVDDVFVNSKNENFIIVNGDIRKLYSKRPPAVENMILAQFATQYYKKRREQKAVMDPNTDIGQESNEPIVGGDTGAPMFMKLSNKIIMKKRSDKSKPIPLLLPFNTLSDYSQRLLFQPWRLAAELYAESTDEDKVQQKQNRLALFPRSIFS